MALSFIEIIRFISRYLVQKVRVKTGVMSATLSNGTKSQNRRPDHVPLTTFPFSTRSGQYPTLRSRFPWGLRYAVHFADLRIAESHV